MTLPDLPVVALPTAADHGRPPTSEVGVSRSESICVELKEKSASVGGGEPRRQSLRGRGLVGVCCSCRGSADGDRVLSLEERLGVSAS